jgi:hypothetical protein
VDNRRTGHWLDVVGIAVVVASLVALWLTPRRGEHSAGRAGRGASRVVAPGRVGAGRLGEGHVPRVRLVVLRDLYDGFWRALNALKQSNATAPA